MKRTALLSAVGAVALLAGATLVLRAAPGDRAASVATIGAASDQVDQPTTTVHHEPDRPVTTVTTVTTVVPVVPHEAAHPPTTTAPPTTSPSTSTTEVRHESAPAQLTLACGAAPTAEHAGVVCEWGHVPDHTARQVMMREQTGPSQPIWATEDVTVRRHVDETAQPGVTYSYRISAYAADGTYLGTSNPVRITPADQPATTSTTTVAEHRGIQLWCGMRPPAEGTHVVCEWEGGFEHTARQVMMREQTGPSQPIWATEDATVRRHVDETAQPGVTYSYRISAYAADGTYLGTSNPVRLTTPAPASGA